MQSSPPTLVNSTHIKKAIRLIANRLNKHSVSVERPIFLVVLSGAFVFAADLVREIDFECEVDFVECKSYQNNEQLETLSFTKLPSLNLEGRAVIILEDLIDSGNTMIHLQQYLLDIGVRQIILAPLLLKASLLKSKPEWFTQDKHKGLMFWGSEIIVGKTIDDFWIYGYGMDDNGLQRNLKQIYYKQ